jgi:thioredoxin 1
VARFRSHSQPATRSFGEPELAGIAASANGELVFGSHAVLEVYSDWCGPCRCINATCKRLFFDLGDRGLKFFTVQSGILDSTKLYVGKCEPVLLFYLNGEQLHDLTLVGVDVPVLIKSIMAKLDTIGNTSGG